MSDNWRPIYRVLLPVILSSDGIERQPGDIVDLSHLPPESRRWFVSNGFFETADGAAVNVPGPIRRNSKR
jgi:hypothetical protein